MYLYSMNKHFSTFVQYLLYNCLNFLDFGGIIDLTNQES
jgi:hypothetical protein